MLNNYSFIKRAAISTDFESAKWRPSNIVKGWMEGLDKSWSSKKDDSFLTKALKSGGRFLLGDLALGTVKGALGAVESIPRLALSGTDMLRGKIKPSEFFARLGDSALDTGMTALTALTGGGARLGAATLARGARYIPFTKARAAHKVFKDANPAISKRIAEQTRGATNLGKGQIYNINKSLDDSLKGISDPVLRDQAKIRAIAEARPLDASFWQFGKKKQEKLIKQQLMREAGLLNTGNIHTTRMALNKGNFGFKDRWNAMRQAGASRFTAASDAAMAMANSTPVQAAMFMPVAGMFTDPDSTANKIFNAPVDLLSAPGKMIDSAKHNVSKNHIKTLIEDGMSPDLLRHVMRYNKRTDSYTINDNAIKTLGQYYAQSTGLPLRDAIPYVLRMFLPNQARNIDLWPNTTNMIEQAVQGRSYLNSHSRDARQQYIKDYLS